jgi:hypothetical protein
VAGHEANVELLTACSTLEEARQLVEPYLTAWEMSAAASQRGWPVFRFQFRGGRIARLDGVPGFTGMREMSASASLAFQLDVLPPAPSRALYGPWIDAIWAHFRNYREGREALVPTAYMCLTLLEASVSGRRQDAAKSYGIDVKALELLGRLTAVADPQKGRKIKGKTRAELTREEEKAIESTLVDIVQAVVRKELT